MALGFVKLRGKMWYFVYPVKDPDTGKDRKKWERAVAYGFPNTQRGAQQALRNRLNAIDAGAPADPSRTTLAEYLPSYIRGLTNVKPSTIHTYETWNRLYITPRLGTHPLRGLTKTLVRSWQASLLNGDPPLRKPIGPGTVASAHALLSSALAAAVEDQLIASNVAASVPKPSIPKRVPAHWSPDQVEQFLAETDGDDDAAIWRLLLLTGMRRGEIMALRWSDIDFHARRLSIVQNRTETRDGKATIGTPKSPSSIRPIDLPASCITALLHHRERQQFRRQRAGTLWKESGLVFTRSDGTMLYENYIDDHLKRRIRASSIEGLIELSPHGLRHTHATFELSLKEHPKVIQERLGHARISTTMDLYSHVIPSMQREAADRIDGALEQIRQRRPQQDDDAADASR